MQWYSKSNKRVLVHKQNSYATQKMNFKGESRWKFKRSPSPAFRKYGRIVKGIDFDELLKAMESTPTPDGVVYEPSIPQLEATRVFSRLRDSVYGGLPVQVGYCNGDNHTLNALEYHRSSEINIACTDMVLLIGMQQDIDPDTYEYDTSKMEAFLVPAGTAVEIYATTLHYAPISSGGKFRVAIVLPKETTNRCRSHPAGKVRRRCSSHGING